MPFPVVLSSVVLLAAPETRHFFDRTLPLLLGGQNEDIQDVSIALVSVAERLWTPAPLTAALQVAVSTATGVLLWLLWRSVDEAEPRRLVELSSILLIGAFLASTFAFPHYGIFLLPLTVSIADPSLPFRDWLTWAALFCLASPIGWQLDLLPDGINEILAERFTFALPRSVFPSRPSESAATRAEPDRAGSTRPRPTNLYSRKNRLRSIEAHYRRVGVTASARRIELRHRR